MQDLQQNAQMAANFMKSLSSPHRLLILCKLIEGKHSVSDLITYTGISQTSMSQHLGRLKQEGIVDFERNHRTLYYYIADQNAISILQLLHDIFCNNTDSTTNKKAKK